MKQIGKVALVTGASRGLGAATAKALAADGWSVAVNYAHDVAGASCVVDEIRARGAMAFAAQFSVTDRDACRRGLEEIARHVGPVDLIVNNATGRQPALSIMDQTWRTYTEQLEFFVKAPLELLQLVLPDWRARKSGRVINIGSETAERGHPHSGNYASAKGAMLSMTRSWAKELGPEGITVNLVAPGWIPAPHRAGMAQEALDGYLQSEARGEVGTPEDVANMVVFLASEKASSITGQECAVNGGCSFL